MSDEVVLEAPVSDESGPVFAFTAVVGSQGCFVGRADAGTKGFTEVPPVGRFSSYDAARRRAEELNEAMGIPAKLVDKIVRDAMR